MIGLFAIAALVSAQAPTYTDVIERAIAAEKYQAAHAWKYTCREDNETWNFDSSGRRVHVQRMTYDHVMLEGGDYAKLILVNGKKLNTKAQKKVDAAMDVERTQRRLHGSTSSRFHYGGSLDKLLQLFDNRLTGEQTVSGRRAWRVESEPKAGYTPANREEEQLLAMRHVFWFDAEEGFEIKETGEFVRDAFSFPAGARLTMEWSRLGEAWIFDTMTFETRAGGQTAHYYDYKRFSVDSLVKPE